jgi:hypothetical protein
VHSSHCRSASRVAKLTTGRRSGRRSGRGGCGVVVRRRVAAAPAAAAAASVAIVVVVLPVSMVVVEVMVVGFILVPSTVMTLRAGMGRAVVVITMFKLASPLLCGTNVRSRSTHSLYGDQQKH